MRCRLFYITVAYVTCWLLFYIMVFFFVSCSTLRRQGVVWFGLVWGRLWCRSSSITVHNTNQSILGFLFACDFLYQRTGKRSLLLLLLLTFWRPRGAAGVHVGVGWGV
ncbi:unnamed protein product [Ectocarpus sp. 12 AP-2014]